MKRHGFTLVELMVAMLITGILASLAIPSIGAMVRRADAARVVADMSAIRVAALDYYAANGSYPASGSAGTVPATLAPSLPRGFSFRYKTVTYRWRRFGLPSGLPSSPGQTVLEGVEVATTDRKLMAAITSALRGRFAFGGPTRITFVIE